jgi:DNA repair protein RadA/Sms
MSWLDGIPGGGMSGGSNNNMGWVRVTDLYPKSEEDGNGDGSPNKNGKPNQRRGQQRIRIPGDDELNNVLGGGIMRGSLTLLGGDPGVGKSTLALQTAGSVASLSKRTQQLRRSLTADDDDDASKTPPPAAVGEEEEGPVWYVSGEENAEQIASRAFRLGIFQPELWLLSETHVDALAELVVQTYHPLRRHMMNSNQKSNNDDDDDNDEEDRRVPLQHQTPSLLVIDSIQTMVCDAGGSSAPGGVTQVRECVALLLRLAKSTGVPVLLIGHVTKDGTVAGPRTIEHMVDCVLYLEGTSEAMSGRDTHNVRLLRAAKNRFGSADELGVYEMTTGRLLPVSDPSSLFLSHRPQLEDDDGDEDDKGSTEGCAIALMLEGRRAMTVEVQAFVTPVGNAGVGGRRTVNGGISTNRLLLLLGVLQKRCGMFWARQDVYLNVVGQTLRWEKSGSGSSANNAADLAVAVACVSSLLSIPVRPDAAFCGEVGLFGELRKMSSSALTKRLQEARRMGFTRVVTPKMAKSPHEQQVPRYPGMEWIQCSTLLAALNAGLTAPVSSARRRRRSESGGGSSKQRPTTTNSWNKGGWKSNAAPSSLPDLMLNDDQDDDEAILDDEPDEYDDEDDSAAFQ